MHVLAVSPTMPGFLNALSGPLNHFGYLAVFFLVLVEDFGIPVPGETILIAAAIYAGHQQLNVVAVGLVGFVAAVIGDNIGFAIGHFGGRALALRWGKYVFLTEERLVQAEKFFDHHGGKVIVAARFIEGLRQANGIIAGIGGMHWRRFVIFNAIGAALWVGTWVSLGYLAGNHIDSIYHYITQYSLYALIAVVAVIAALIIRHVVRRRRRAARREAEAQEGRAAPDHAETPERQETPDHAEIQDHAEAPEQAGTTDRAEARDSTEARDSAEAQNQAGTQHGTKTSNGVPAEDSAETQSS
jgi:membrane protein DedA with SNARE-associated domain